MENYNQRYPEKSYARLATTQIKIDKNYHKHHWSYNKQHRVDFIALSYQDHAKLHRYMIYDQERMMYRTIEGVLLDSKEKHIEYFNSLIEKP